MLKPSLSLILLSATVAAGAGLGKAVKYDADSNCYYMPPRKGARPPCLVILSCTGARRVDLDTCRMIADSLGWALATCRASRNHRSSDSNDLDITRVLRRLRSRPIDTTRVFLFGFSGQGVQALQTMFRHPELVRGVVSTCGHTGGLPPAADWPELGSHVVYLVTRQRDWNRHENEMMYALLSEQGIASELVVTPGEHGPGPCGELLGGCHWLEQQTR